MYSVNNTKKQKKVTAKTPLEKIEGTLITRYTHEQYFWENLNQNLPEKSESPKFHRMDCSLLNRNPNRSSENILGNKV